jgi:hypothetical protein
VAIHVGNLQIGLENSGIEGHEKTCIGMTAPSTGVGAV